MAKRLVRRVYPGAGQPVEEGGLAGVGVADERDHRHSGTPARAAVDLAPALHGVELPADPLDALADEPPIRLELGLARPPQPDAAALAFEMGPAPHQPGREVAKLRQLHLESALEGARPPREDVEDEADPVEHPALETRFEVTFLGGASAGG